MGNKSDQDWKKVLSEDQYRVLREKATEPQFSGKYDAFFEDGTYKCAACKSQLFESGKKFDAHCGWPSFYDALPGAVEFHEDNSMGMQRVEVICAKCGGHLGHVFDDAPDQPTGQRYCINSISLDFTPDNKK